MICRPPAKLIERWRLHALSIVVGEPHRYSATQIRLAWRFLHQWGAA